VIIYQSGIHIVPTPNSSIQPLTVPWSVKLWIVITALAFPIVVIGSIFANNPNLPLVDTAVTSLQMAVNVQTGEFSPWDIVTFRRGHRHGELTSNIVNAILAYTTAWNLSVGRIVLALIATTTLLFFWAVSVRTIRSATLLILIPTAWLYFTPSNIFALIMVNAVVHQTVILLTIGAFAVVMFGPIRVWTLSLAIFLCFLATLDYTPGVFSWGLVLVAMRYRGYRKVWSYLTWGVMAAIAAAVWFWLTGSGISTDSTAVVQSGIVLQSPAYILQYVSILLSRPFYGGTNLGIATLIGSAALIMFLINTGVIWFHRHEREIAITWIMIAGFSLGTNALTSVSAQYDGLNSALFVRYITMTSVFWIAFFALAGHLIMLQISGTSDRWIPAVATVNGVVLGLLALLFVPATDTLYHTNGENQVKDINEHCHMRLLYLRDNWQLQQEGCVIRNSEMLDPLAYHELAMFAHKDPLTIPALKVTGNIPVIQTSHDGRINFNTQKWLLHDLSPEQVLHIAPEHRDIYTADLPNFITGDDPTLRDTVTAFIEGVDAFWYIYQLSEWEPDYYHVIDLTDGFVDDFDYIEQTYETLEGVPFYLRLYFREPDTETPLATFGPQVQLLSTRVIGELAACNDLTIVSYWRVTTPLEMGVPYSLSLFVDSSGNVVSRNDGQLSVVPSHTWTPEQTYTDIRQLSLPCDLPDEGYEIRASVYDYRDGVRLTLNGEEAAPDTVLLSSAVNN
jgi:hypothetical protein